MQHLNRAEQAFALRALLALATLGLGATLVSAQEARMDLGVLTCTFATQEDAPAGSEPVAAQTQRSMLCTFKPLKVGAEETYAGGFQSVGKEEGPPHGQAMLWIVKGPYGQEVPAGILQQSYAAEAALTPGSLPLLVGETNKQIVLQTMNDARDPVAPDKATPIQGTLIVLMSLTLRSTPA